MATKKTKPAAKRTKPALSGKPILTVPGIVPAIRVPGIKPVPGIVVPSVVPKITPGIKPVPGIIVPSIVPRITPAIIAPGIVPFVPKISPGIKPPAPKYPSGEIVQINLSKYCAVELLNALIVALGIVPPGKKGKKGKKP
jgi:signal-induced proliferation-associated 1 like protein 3